MSAYLGDPRTQKFSLRITSGARGTDAEPARAIRQSLKELSK